MAEPRDAWDGKIIELHGKGLRNEEIAQALDMKRTTLNARMKKLDLKPHTLPQDLAERLEQCEPTPSHFPVEDIHINWLSRDARTQIRVRLDDQTINAYAEAMRAGKPLPPIVVFQEHETYWIADGWHRVEAASQSGFMTLRAEVRPGSLDDALDHACSANARHGLRLTLEDQRKAVGLQLTRHPERSDREIARLSGCRPTMVNTYRKQLEMARRVLSRPVHMDTSTKQRLVPAEPFPASETERPADQVNSHTTQGPLESGSTSAPISTALRRQLSLDELDAAARALGRGEPLPRVATGLGVMPWVLRRQVLQLAWDTWCEVHGLPPSGLPGY